MRLNNTNEESPRRRPGSSAVRSAGAWWLLRFEELAGSTAWPRGGSRRARAGHGSDWSDGRRRHLDESQRAMIGARIASLGRGGDQSANLRNAPTAEEAASMLNVSARSIETARSVQRKADPELVAAVDAGKVAVSTAAKLVALPLPPACPNWTVSDGARKP